ncbi:hypothetical protein RhiirA5_504760 [Rhizophagus irregularis]|uniref:Uncharacterized protein n=1 Tax=Rhizophagus irregularis TaxID=588596 RepID=A0A2N0P2Y2_9GLOM|nr:hypothetical protein RhiirA5_504760 [Rhizophagus irregularis]
MSNPFEYIRNRVQQHNINQLARICNQVSKKFSDMPAIVIQWNNGGFNDVPISPNNRNGIAGQNKNAIINFLTANGAVNYHDTVFLFRDGPALATCEHNLPQWEFSSENFDYYGITDEKLCPLCKLGHGEEESIEGRHTSESYFIKCEQHKIEGSKLEPVHNCSIGFFWSCYTNLMIKVQF